MTDTLTRIDSASITPAAAQALRSGAVVAFVPAGVFDLSGPGAVACMQGLLTNDIERPGDGAFVYGALLTPKGMIVVDGWAARRGEVVRFTTSAEGRERAAQLFQRSIPPRLARVADRSAELRVLRLAGPAALRLAEAARLPIALPEGAGMAQASGDVEVARTPGGAPFVLQWIGPPPSLDEIRDRLTAAGAAECDPVTLQLARILDGWPGLVSEVDDRTLPQEIRYDEIGGVSYTKGCYTGQETVSRVHFRGHPNRALRGLLLSAEPPAQWRTAQPVLLGDKEVGRLTSVAWVPEGPPGSGVWMGLAVLRREVDEGATVLVGMIEAKVLGLPLPIPRFDPA
jgi:folate-binding protein YgfZ